MSSFLSESVGGEKDPLWGPLGVFATAGAIALVPSTPTASFWQKSIFQKLSSWFPPTFTDDALLSSWDRKC